MYRILIFVLLLITWMVFSGIFDVFHLTLGLFSCALVTWISSEFLFENRAVGWEDRVQEGIKLPGYLAWLFWQIVLANFHLLRLALAPGGIDEVEPDVVCLKTHLKTDFAKFVLAQSITLTPGTVTLKIIGNDFYVHGISRMALEGLDGSMERRIAAVFEPSNEASLMSGGTV